MIWSTTRYVWYDSMTVQSDNLTVWQCDSETVWQCDSETVTVCQSMVMGEFNHSWHHGGGLQYLYYWLFILFIVHWSSYNANEQQGGFIHIYCLTIIPGVFVSILSTNTLFFQLKGFALFPWPHIVMLLYHITTKVFFSRPTPIGGPWASHWLNKGGREEGGGGMRTLS